MGLLSLFSKPTPALLRLPTGSFTVDREGAVVVSTLPSGFPLKHVQDIAEQVVSSFRDAAEAQLPLSELIISYPSLKVTARELRGGAIIYLTPKASYAATTHN